MDSVKIYNGGRFVHKTSNSHTSYVSRLSRAPGTEKGIFEFDVPGAASYTISLSGRTYGNLELSSSAAGVSKPYLSNGITTAVELENSGMYYIIEVAGNTKKPTQCNTISVKYAGKLQSGVLFDPAPSTGQTVSTANFQLGRLIEGWKRALPLVGEGGKMKLYIPPALGYGAAGLQDRNTGNIIIPANQIIIFDMELTAVN